MCNTLYKQLKISPHSVHTVRLPSQLHDQYSALVNRHDAFAHEAPLSPRAFQQSLARASESGAATLRGIENPSFLRKHCSMSSPIKYPKITLKYEFCSFRTNHAPSSTSFGLSRAHKHGEK